MDDAWWLAALSAVIAGSFALAGTRLGGRTEHAKWRREQRRDAYAEFIRSVDHTTTEVASKFSVQRFDDPTSAPYSMDELTSIMLRHVPEASLVAIVGPPQVYEAAQKLIGTEGKMVPLLMQQIVDRSNAAEPNETAYRELQGIFRRQRDEFLRLSRKALGTN